MTCASFSVRRAVVALACVGLWPAVAPGQRATGDSALDALVAQALAGNPAIRAAAMRVDAARARVGPAGARPDPMLMLGVVDFPYHQPGFADNFTMNTVRLTQAIPYPGKLSLATRAADEDAESARALLDQTKLDAVRDVEIAYYQLAYLRRAREIVEQNSAVLGGLVKVAQARYEVGTGVQADALRARIEAARLGDQASVLAAQERTALARLNAVLDRPSDTPVDAPEIPLRIARLAVADSASRVQFSSAALGAAPNDSPLLPVDSIVALAVARSPMLRAHEAQIAAQERRLALAEKAHLPDFDVSLEYDQRPHFPDYLSFFVSVPLPLQRARKQNQDVAAARADLAALHAEHATEVDAVRTEVASLTSDAERSRTQLALSVKAVLPQAHAALASATASYEVGRIDFPALVDAQAELFNEETAYARALTDFATTLARLVSVVGTAEVVR